jgi:hypothetical protein
VSIDNHARATEQPTDAELAANERLRARPENLRFGIHSVGALDITYYRLNPPDEEFFGNEPGDFPVSVGLCGMYGYDALSEPPTKGSEFVVLGISGAVGRRLTNVLLERDDALRLAKLLKQAAKKVARDV